MLEIKKILAILLSITIALTLFTFDALTLKKATIVDETISYEIPSNWGKQTEENNWIVITSEGFYSNNVSGGSANVKEKTRIRLSTYPLKWKSRFVSQESSLKRYLRASGLSENETDSTVKKIQFGNFSGLRYYNTFESDSSLVYLGKKGRKGVTVTLECSMCFTEKSFEEHIHSEEVESIIKSIKFK